MNGEKTTFFEEIILQHFAYQCFFSSVFHVSKGF